MIRNHRRRIERLVAGRARRTELLEAAREAIDRPRRIRRDAAGGDPQRATFRVVYCGLEYVGDVVIRPYDQSMHDQKRSLL